MRANPDYRKRKDAEDYIGHELCCCHSGAFGHLVRDVGFEGGVEGHEADIEAFSSYPGLEAIPDCDG